MGIIILFAWERIILDNGLTVIYEQDTTFPVVSVQLWYRVGSVYEYPGITGISHLLEHMMFRKTKNLDYGEYGERVRELGGEYNGATSYDYTFYYINIAKDRWEEALKLESERMQNLVVDSADFERERKVVLEEYLRGISNPLGKFYREFNYLLYLNHPYRQPIIGYRSDIENISWGEVYEHYEKFYSPSNAVLVIVGDVERNEMLEAVKEYFGHIRKKPPGKIRIPEGEEGGERRMFIRENVPYRKIAMGFPVPPRGDPDYTPCLLLSYILSGERGYLKKHIKEFDVSAYLNRRKFKPALIVTATFDEKISYGHAESLILTVLSSLPDSLTPRMLKRAKEKAITDIYSMSSSPFMRANFLGYLECTGHVEDGDTLLGQIQGTKIEDIKRVIEKYIKRERMAVLTMGREP